MLMIPLASRVLSPRTMSWARAVTRVVLVVLAMWWVWGWCSGDARAQEGLPPQQRQEGLSDEVYEPGPKDGRGTKSGDQKNGTRRSEAKAQDRHVEGQAPGSSLGRATHLTLTRAAIGECDWHPGCQAAVVHVLIKRHRLSELQHLTLAEVARRYCSPLKTTGPRAKWVQGLPRDVGRYRRHWELSMELVAGVIDGWVTDPCPGAVHFGSAEDGKQGRMVLRCILGGQRFYGVGR